MCSFSPQPLDTSRVQSHCCCQHGGRHEFCQSFGDCHHTAHHLSAGHKHICRYVLGLVKSIFIFYCATSCLTILYLSDLTSALFYTLFVVFFSLMSLSFLFSTAYYSCCRSYMKSRISFNVIQGYSVQTATGMCPIDAIM